VDLQDAALLRNHDLILIDVASILAVHAEELIEIGGAFIFGVPVLQELDQVVAIDQCRLALVDGLEPIFDPSSDGLGVQPNICKQGTDFLDIVSVPVPDAVMRVEALRHG